MSKLEVQPDGLQQETLEQSAEKLKENGGFLDDNVNKNTFVLIVKELDDNSNKIKKAKEFGIRIMIPVQFKEEYF